MVWVVSNQPCRGRHMGWRTHGQQLAHPAVGSRGCRLRTDTDGDTLTDRHEVEETATDPTLADTDGERLDDAMESVESGTNPLVASNG